MDQLAEIDKKITCFVHDLRTDKDWVNIKKSLARAPQIFKQKVNIGHQVSLDEQFESLKEVFSLTNQRVKLLVSHIENYSKSITKNLDTGKNLAKCFRNLYQLELGGDSFDHTSTLDLDYFENCSARVLNDIQPELELLNNNVKQPLIVIQNIMKCISQQIKEREYISLDTAKYLNEIESLKQKATDKTSAPLTLKQEQNLVRYTKHYELANYKLGKITEALKHDLIQFNRIMAEIISTLLVYVYFLQLSISYKFLDFEKYFTNFNDRTYSNEDIISSFKQQHDQYKALIEKSSFIAKPFSLYDIN